MRIIGLVVILLSFFSPAAQVQPAGDTAQATRFLATARSFRTGARFDSAYYYAHAAEKICRREGYLAGLTRVYLNLGLTSIGEEKLVQCIVYERAALFLAIRLKDTAAMVNAYNALGTADRQLGNYPSGIQNYLSCLALSERSNNTSALANAYNNLGNLYASQNDLAASIKHLKKAVEIKRKSGNEGALSQSLNNLGNVLIGANRFAEALPCLDEAYAIALKNKDRFIEVNVLSNLGRMWFTKGTVSEQSPDSARKYFKRALAIDLRADSLWRQEGDSLDIAGSEYLLAQAYLKLGKYKEAKRLLESALGVHVRSESIEYLPVLYDTYAQLSELTHDYKEAFNYFKLSTLYTDSITNEENTRKTVRAQMNYEFVKKETAARAVQEKKDAMAAAEKRRQQIVLWSISVFGVLVFGFAIFAYRSYLQKKKANREITAQKHLIEEKQKEILDSIYYARRIQRSLMPNERSIEKMLKRH